eukprot:TRINITY_DN40763_c0_g1_i1.p1 TRINITY_DN40763_c0_g1~~TRINITY_DN40763_c0_g1_i1.p1  ORF type:complete len:353 (+),score=36.50 TRINITY_DN40763_c0_g1_i1:858-1916(+)
MGEDFEKDMRARMAAARAWLEPVEEPLRPQQRILDAHVHLWNERLGRGKSGGGGWVHALMSAEYSAHDYRSESATLNVAGIVYVECHEGYTTDAPEHLRYTGETVRVHRIASEEAAAGRPLIAGVVAKADFTLPLEQLRQQIDAHRSASAMVKGVRFAAAYSETGYKAAPRPHVLREAGVRSALEWYSTLGLTFETWLFWSQLDDLIDLAKDMPGLPILVDHVAFPRNCSEAGVFDEWSQKISELAGCSNVRCKVGGLTMPACGFGFNLQTPRPSSEAIADTLLPWYKHCIQAFGVERCMFESNFPVDKGSCGYVTLWNTFWRVSDALRLSADQVDMLCYRNAKDWYRLDIE